MTSTTKCGKLSQGKQDLCCILARSSINLRSFVDSEVLRTIFLSLGVEKTYWKMPNFKLIGIWAK